KTSGPGTVKANLTYAVANFSGNNFRSASFNNGTPTDLDADTDIDIGTSLTPLNGGTGNMVFRNASGQAPVSRPNTPNLFIVGAGNTTVFDLSGANSLLQYILGSPSGGNFAPLWVENG